MIGRGKIGTVVHGGGVRIDIVRVYPTEASATSEGLSPWAYNGLVRAGFSLTKIKGFDASVRTHGQTRPTSLPVLSGTNRLRWNGRQWVPLPKKKWVQPLRWNGSEWVP